MRDPRVLAIALQDITAVDSKCLDLDKTLSGLDLRNRGDFIDEKSRGVTSPIPDINLEGKLSVSGNLNRVTGNLNQLTARIVSGILLDI